MCFFFAFCPWFVNIEKEKGIAEAWTGHALISRQKEINFRVQAVQRQAKTKLSYSIRQ